MEALTPRERQFAGLEAKGLSRREIAETLRVTVKTARDPQRPLEKEKRPRQGPNL
jgi:DNA-binding CsgD family transcriptional regulator